MKCIWCESDTREGVKDCYWIVPDGKSSVEITDVPAVDCPGCGKYVSESMSQTIEELLYLNDLSSLGPKFSYDALKNAPRITKSYFK